MNNVKTETNERADAVVVVEGKLKEVIKVKEDTLVVDKEECVVVLNKEEDPLSCH